MSSILLYHDLGLGDHIMSHGIIREYCKKYDKIGIFCLPHNYPTVSFMYRDIPNLTIIKGDTTLREEFINQNASQSEILKYDEIKTIGATNLDWNSGMPVEWQLYQDAGVPLKKKWDNFFVKRDLTKEHTLYDLIAPKKDYAFIHEDRKRHYVIDREKIDKDCAIITPNKEVVENIFEYCTIIEKAKEVHVIDSSFMFLIDCLPYNNPNQKLYIHRYSRKNAEWLLPILKKDWHIFLEEPSKFDPLKNFLVQLYKSNTPILKHSVFKRVIRKVFWIMGWPIMRSYPIAQLKRPDINALIRRYVPGKSFIDISSKKNVGDVHVLIAQEMGAVEAAATSIKMLGSTYPADIVFCAETLSGNSNSIELLRQLRSITKDVLIISTPSTIGASGKSSGGHLNPSDIESMLIKAGFKTREKHLFPFEGCFVCRAIQN